MSQGHARSLSEIAAACEQEVKQQDEKAQVIIRDFRESLPAGNTAPPPPPELKAMWDERNAIILRYRDRVRETLGEETFARLDDFAKFRYGTNKAPVALKPVHPASK